MNCGKISGCYLLYWMSYQEKWCDLQIRNDDEG